MERVHPVHKNDQRNRSIEDNKLQRRLPQYRDQLEEEVKDVFIWAIGQTAVTEMTKTVREKEPYSLPLHRLYAVFRLHFIPERNKHHRADFFYLRRENLENRQQIPGNED